MGEGSCRIGLIPIYIFQCNSFLYQTYNSIFFREKNEHENAGSVVQVPGSNRKRRRPKIVGVRVNLPPPPCILGTIKHRMTKILTTHRGGGFCSPPPSYLGNHYSRSCIALSQTVQATDKINLRGRGASAEG